MGRTFCLRKLARMSCNGELTLGDAHGLQLIGRGRWSRKSAKAKLVHIVVVVEAGLAQGLVKLLQIGRHHAIAQLHRRARILHGPIVDDHQLLHVVRNRRARVARQLRRITPAARRLQKCSSNRNPTRTSQQLSSSGNADRLSGLHAVLPTAFSAVAATPRNRPAEVADINLGLSARAFNPRQNCLPHALTDRRIFPFLHIYSTPRQDSKQFIASTSRGYYCSGQQAEHRAAAPESWSADRTQLIDASTRFPAHRQLRESGR